MATLPVPTFRHIDEEDTIVFREKKYFFLSCSRGRAYFRCADKKCEGRALGIDNKYNFMITGVCTEHSPSCTNQYEEVASDYSDDWVPTRKIRKPGEILALASCTNQYEEGASDSSDDWVPTRKIRKPGEILALLDKKKKANGRTKDRKKQRANGSTKDKNKKESEEREDGLCLKIKMKRVNGLWRTDNPSKGESSSSSEDDF